jgi:hypothetical protein
MRAAKVVEGRKFWMFIAEFEVGRTKVTSLFFAPRFGRRLRFRSGAANVRYSF